MMAVLKKIRSEPAPKKFALTPHLCTICIGFENVPVFGRSDFLWSISVTESPSASVGGVDSIEALYQCKAKV